MAWRYCIGILLGVIALGFILDQMNVVPGLGMPTILMNWWPLLVVILSLNYLVRHPENPIGTLTLVGFGLFLLVRSQGIMLDDVWTFTWAVLLLLFALRLVMPRAKRQQPADKSGISAIFRPTVKDFVLFGGTHNRNESQHFEGGHVLTMMGDYELDLREAMLSFNGAELDVNTMFGSVVIRIPQEMSYRIDGQPFLGVLDNRARTLVPDEPGRPVLHIRCRATLSGVTITN